MNQTKPDRQTAEAVIATVERTGVGIVITDPRQDDNPIIYVNDGFVSLTQFSRDYAVGRNCRFLQGQETDEDELARIREALANGDEVEVRLTNYKADGTPFRNQLLISPVRDESGELTAYFAVLREITGDESGADKGARPSHVTPSNVMLYELQHRMKNHLAMIVSLIRMHAGRKLTRESMEALAHRVEALALLYDAMLSPGDAEDTETVRAGAYLSRVANVIGNINSRPSISLNVDCDPMRLPIDLAGRLGLLATELLTNTYEHAFEGREAGMVAIRLVRLEKSGVVRLEVEDDGIGLPEGSEWPKGSSSIFEQQTRATEEAGALDTTSAGGASGLGGSIVLSLTETIGATIDVRSGPSGTTVTVDLKDVDLPTN